MSGPAAARDWRQRALAAADRAPLRPRLALLAGAARIGSVEADFQKQIGLRRPAGADTLLQKGEHDGAAACVLQGDVAASLNRLAVLLGETGMAGPWRDEQLAVRNGRGEVLGTVERAAARPLGIETHAVHLVGLAPDGRMWVQRRSLSKATEPGKLDTLVGGMVPAADTLLEALQREAWEEAGVAAALLRDAVHAGRVTMRMPAHDGSTGGYVIEQVDWFRCTFPQDWRPANQDGEVSEFLLLDRTELEAQLEEGAFTAEAARVLCDAL